MFETIKQLIYRPVIIDSKWKKGILALSSVGLLDTGYLTYSHYEAAILKCFGVTVVNSCQVVTESIYSTILGVPVAVIGLAFYLFIFVTTILSFKSKYNFLLNLFLPLTGLAVLMSLRLVYLQISVIQYICYYCMLSATLSLLLFIISGIIYKKINKI